MMERRSLRVLLALPCVVSMLVPIPVRAEPGGCEVLATGHPDMRGDCRYVATGPGEYEVVSTSGFIISASSDGGETFRTLASKVGTHDRPETALAVQRGTLDTKPGDVVVAAIAIATYITAEPAVPEGVPPPPPGVPRPPPGMRIYYQDGFIRAGDVG